MPTHVHLFCEAGSCGLKHALEDFKRWTGHQAAKLLNTDHPHFWQGEWFDHWSRSDAEDERIVAYIRNNPVKAGLVRDYTDWPHASWRR
jgi:putative transposase